MSERRACRGCMNSTRFTSIGPPAYVGDLAQALQTRGLSADYRPPLKTKDLAVAVAAGATWLHDGPVPLGRAGGGPASPSPPTSRTLL